MNQLHHYLFHFCIFFAIHWGVFAQTTHTNARLGVPFISNFNPEDYEADPQNWDIAQDEHGIIYVANTVGLLKYDGVGWDKIELPNIICRSVVYGADKVIYVGSQSDIGYLQPNKIGTLHYVSLLPKIPEKDTKFADVWSTFSNRQGVFFFAGNYIFLYSQSKITTFTAPKKFDFCFDIREVIYTQDESVGLCQIADKKFGIANNGAYFIGKQIRSMMPYGERDILIATLKDGLFIYNPQSGEITPFQTPVTDYLTQNLIFCGKALAENRFAIGTFQNGLVIINDKGTVEQIVNENIGLRNNSVRKIFVDHHQGVWLALNNGISRIELHSPFSIFDKRTNLRGNVNHICQNDNTLLVASSLGIFELVTSEQQTNYQSASFQQIQGFKDQAWQLTPVDNSIFIGSNTGTFIYQKNKPIMNISTNAAFVHLRLKDKPSIVLAGLRNGIEIFEYKNNQWKLLKQIDNFSEEVRTLIQDNEGKIWAGTKVNGIYCLDITAGIEKITMINFTQKDGLPNNKQNRVFYTTQGVVVGTPKGFFSYDKKSNQFKTHDFLKIPKNWQDNKEAWQLAEDTNGNFGIWTERYKGLYEKQKDNHYKWNSTLFSRIPLETVNQIFTDNESIWIGTANALYAYNKKFSYDSKTVFSVLFRKISLIHQDSVVAQSYYNYLENSQKLRFKDNSLSFDFAATHFDVPEANLYQYQLDGYDKTWSPWTEETKKDYTNLWNGKYKLKVKAKNIYGEMSDEKSYTFEISPPWYRTNIAYITYVIIFISLLYFIIKAYTLRLEKANIKLEKIVLQRTAEIQQQKEEIETQRDNLGQLYNEIEEQKQEIEKSYQNVKLLSQIGTTLTSIREIENIITTFYSEVNKLMKAPVFAVGIHNNLRNRLDFYGIDAIDKPLSYGYDTLEDNNQLSVWCFQNNKDVFINNFDIEYKNYVSEIAFPEERKPISVMYVPLNLNGNIFGVITVHAFERNAYNEYHRTMFNNLATYVSIALDNANAYNLISVKNRQITDSIRYAQTIQKAILPTQEELDTALNHNYFVFYQPKDVVSGDFYWLMSQSLAKPFVMVAVVDCTGHGVPGAFMSLIGATLLNEITEQKQIFSPAEIITTLNHDIRNLLRQNEQANRDGMDICLCKLEKKNEQITLLTYAGAKRTLFIVDQKQELHSIRSTHKSVGGGNKEHIDFEEFSYELQKNDMLYLTTDGYTDQNDSHNNKFGTVKFKEMIQNISQQSLTSQYSQIQNAFFTHQGNDLQRDDVTVMGIKI